MRAARRLWWVVTMVLLVAACGRAGPAEDIYFRTVRGKFVVAGAARGGEDLTKLRAPVLYRPGAEATPPGLLAGLLGSGGSQLFLEVERITGRGNYRPLDLRILLKATEYGIPAEQAATEGRYEGLITYVYVDSGRCVRLETATSRLLRVEINCKGLIVDPAVHAGASSSSTLQLTADFRLESPERQPAPTPVRAP